MITLRNFLLMMCKAKILNININEDDKIKILKKIQN